jgi:enterochelin esterase-like enzyme
MIVLLHGLRGAPGSFVGGLRLAAVADELISARRVPPFIAVMPPAGRSVAFDGEWTGPWETYVAHDVMRWARAHLPVERSASGRAIAGFSAGGYGAVDIALRHGGSFGAIASLSGSYEAPHDGSLAHASRAQLAAHDPTLLVRRDAASLRRHRTRIYLAAGNREAHVLADSRRFARLLARLHIAHDLVVVRGGHHGRTWRLALPAALTYALDGVRWA